MVRRKLLSQLASLPLFALIAAKAQKPSKVLKIMMKSAWGSDRTTQRGRRFRSLMGWRWLTPGTKSRFSSLGKPHT